MFTCPEKDIHSIYLDGELPANFAKYYEAHIANCEKCRKEIERLRAMHNIFASDSAAINLNKEFLDKSFERLQGRMRFTNVVKMSQPKKNAFSMRTLIPMAAAAAAVFAIMLPTKMNSTQAAPAENLPVISKAQEITPIAKSDVFVEGGIQEVALHTESTEENAAQKTNAKPLEIKASNFEMLKPEESEENGMTIRLTELTNMNTISAANVSFEQFNALDFSK